MAKEAHLRFAKVSGFTSEPPFRVRRDRVHQSKEFSLLDFIVTRVPRGDLSALLATVKRFAGEKEWLKVAGGSKARLLQAGDSSGDSGGHPGGNRWSCSIHADPFLFLEHSLKQ